MKTYYRMPSGNKVGPGIMDPEAKEHTPPEEAGSGNGAIPTEPEEVYTMSAAGKKNTAVPPDPTKQLTLAGSGNSPSQNKMMLPPIKFFDYNLYAVKKSIASALLDMALLMANASQLKSLMLNASSHPFYYATLVLLIISILLQIVAGVALIVLSKININETSNRQQAADSVNTAIVVCVFLLTIVNVFISAFGITAAGPNTAYGTTPSINSHTPTNKT